MSRRHGFGLEALGVALVAAAALLPASAFAYPAPSGLGSNTTLCPARPADLSTATLNPVPASGQAVVAAGQAWTSATFTGGGEQTIFLGAITGVTGWVKVLTQNSSGTWLAYVQMDLPGGSNPGSTLQFFSPPGPEEIQIVNSSSASQSFTYGLTSTNADAGANYTAQELADGCQLTVTDQAQTHGDLGTLDTDVKGLQTGQLDTDVKGLQSGQLDADLKAVNTGALFTEVKQLDTDITSFASANHTDLTGLTHSSTAQDVALSTPDRVELADSESALHSDIWLLLGAVVACWVGHEVLSRIL